MKAILQRVKSASVTVDNQLVSTIGRGILVLAAVGRGDTNQDAETLAAKVLKLKLWDDERGSKWKKDVREIQGEILCVSQFTLLATTKKGNKPDFHRSADAASAREIYDHFVHTMQKSAGEVAIKDGVFQAHMDVALVNDGPVTLELATTTSETKPVHEDV